MNAYISASLYCNALCYYLDHIEVELRHGRIDFLRHFADPACALVNGYFSQGTLYKGDWKKFKLSWYASNDAIQVINVNSVWNTRGLALRMEHVVPLSVVGGILLSTHKANPYSKSKLLADLQCWVIPCLIAKAQDNALSAAGFHSHMPPSWTPSTGSKWARYQQTPWGSGFLIN